MLCLQSMNINHGDIQPSNILVTESGEIKLIDIMCYTSLNTGFSRMLTQPNYFAPLSPIQMAGYSAHSADIAHNQEKSDIFALGITMLCAATNQHHSAFYDFHRKKIRFNEIYKEVEKQQARGYSRLLVGCLSNMLSRDEYERPAAGELLQFINKNSENRM